MGFQTSVTEFPPIGYAGTLDARSRHDAITLKSVESSASMPFGVAVCFKTSAPLTDLDALLPAATTDKVAGILKFSHAYARAWTDDAGTTFGDLDGTGLRPGALLSVVRNGRILVKCGSGCKPGDRLFIRALGSGADGGTKGNLENAADSSNMIDATTQGQWLTTAVAGGLAWLEVDFLNK